MAVTTLQTVLNQVIQPTELHEHIMNHEERVGHVMISVAMMAHRSLTCSLRARKPRRGEATLASREASLTPHKLTKLKPHKVPMISSPQGGAWCADPRERLHPIRYC
jgi:hypothetical protein